MPRAKIKLPSIDRYLTRLRKSKLLDQDRLDSELAKLTNNGSLGPDSQRFGLKLIESNLLTPWQHSRLMSGGQPRFIVGKYKLLSRLGSGGMSEVYLAEHSMVGRQVALKVLHENLEKNSLVLERFFRESQATAALDHPNIVRAHDLDQDGDTHFLVMEYVPGRTLERIVKDDSPLPPALVADYIRQAADGLNHAHQAGLVHRDVKPGNLLVTPRGVVKLLDLGLARIPKDGESSLTQFNQSILGTADYLPPEQAVDSHEVDARADVYGLGCVFYFLLAGHPPFNEGSVAMRLVMHQTTMPKPIAELRDDVPASLAEICVRMMAKLPEDRFQSATEVSRALDEWMDAAGAHKTIAGDQDFSVDGDGAGTTLPGAARIVSIRSSDVHGWRFRDYLAALNDGDERLATAIKRLAHGTGENPKLAEFISQLLRTASLDRDQDGQAEPSRITDRDSLRELFGALARVKNQLATTTLIRVVIGQIHLAAGDRTCAGLAIDAMAANMTPARRKFLVRALAFAENVRDPTPGGFSASELRLKAASVLAGHQTDEVRQALLAQLADPMLRDDARSLIESLLL